MKEGVPKSNIATFTAASTDTTVYQVSSKRKFVLTDVIVANKEGSAVTVTIYDGSGGTLKMAVEVPANDTKAIVGIENGPEFYTSVVAQVSAYTNGSYITVGGYEE